MTVVEDPGASGDLQLFDNLMHPLAAQVKLVCDFSERLPLNPHDANYFISFCICCRARLEWAPLPIGNLFHSRDSIT